MLCNGSVLKCKFSAVEHSNFVYRSKTFSNYKVGNGWPAIMATLSPGSFAQVSAILCKRSRSSLNDLWSKENSSDRSMISLARGLSSVKSNHDSRLLHFSSSQIKTFLHSFQRGMIAWVRNLSLDAAKNMFS